MMQEWLKGAILNGEKSVFEINDNYHMMKIFHHSLYLYGECKGNFKSNYSEWIICKKTDKNDTKLSPDMPING